MTTTEAAPSPTPAGADKAAAPALIQGWTDALGAGATTRQAATAALQRYDDADRSPSDPLARRNVELLQTASLTDLLTSALAALATSSDDAQCVNTADWLWTGGAATATEQHGRDVAIALALMLLAEGAGIEHSSVIPFAD